MRTTLPRLAVLIALVFLMVIVESAHACPNCKEALANQDGDAMRLANGYSWSILLMLAMPFTLLGAGTLMIVRAVKRGALPEM